MSDIRNAFYAEKNLYDRCFAKIIENLDYANSQIKTAYLLLTAGL